MTGPAWLILGGAVAGLIAGSFLATLVIRWPAARSVNGRSKCDACHRTLSARDLIPVLSFLIQRGRCRTCGAEIDRRHFAIEILAALIGAVAMAASPGWTGAAGALFGWQLLGLAALDVEHFWLPDRLTMLLAATGFAWAVSEGGEYLTARLIGGAAGFGVLFLIAAVYQRVRGRSGMGAGDPKLLGAIGLWLGWQGLPFVLLGASGLGLFLALLMKARGEDVAADTRLPLGAFMAVASFPVWILLAPQS